MKGIRVSLQGLLLVACAQVIPVQAGSITINTVNTGEVMRQGTFPSSPTDVYSHSPVLQELSYHFIGFNPTGTAMEDQERSGYLVYDVSGVTDPIIDAKLEFEVNVTDATPGELVVNTIDPGALGTVMAAPVGPLTKAQFDNVFAALSGGVTAATQVLGNGSATLSVGLGAVGVSHLSSAVSLVGFHVMYVASFFQDLALVVDVAPTLLLTTLSASPSVAAVPAPSTIWLFGPGILMLAHATRKRRMRRCSKPQLRR